MGQLVNAVKLINKYLIDNLNYNNHDKNTIHDKFSITSFWPYIQ